MDKYINDHTINTLSVITGGIISTGLLSTIGSLTHFDLLNNFSIILTIFIGIIVQMGIVWIRPPYQLSRTENAFYIQFNDCYNVIITSYFYSRYFCTNWRETNLEKKAQLALLPYTIGATINFMYIKFKSNRIAQKQKNMLEVIYLLEENDIDCLSPTQNRQ